MYDSTSGRFLERDPAGDLYGYCADDPTNEFDPTGLEKKTSQQIADLLKKRYDDQTNLLGGILNLFIGGKPEDTESYKQLKQALDQIRKDCEKASALPLALAPCGAAVFELVIKDLISKLGHLQFAVREEATGSLAGILPFAVDALREAAKSGDPEVRRRAEKLLERFQSNCVLDQLRQAIQKIPKKDRDRLMELITTSPSAFPNSGMIKAALVAEGTPLPPPKKPAPAMPPAMVPPGPVAPPLPPQNIIS
jgi:hypothetical protein